MAKQELFLGMRYMFLALNMLGYKADRRIRFVATDGRFLYYNSVLLIERDTSLISHRYPFSLFHNVSLFALETNLLVPYFPID